MMRTAASAEAMQNGVQPLPQFTIPAAIIWPLLAALFFLLSLHAVTQGDIWFLLLAGSYVLDTGQVPHTEFFQYTAIGEYELFGGWGYGLLAELSRRLAGLPGISMMNAALWCGTFLLSFAAARIRYGRTLRQAFSTGEIIAFLLAGLIVLPALISRMWLRPEATIYLLWSLGSVLFERDRRNTTRHGLIFYPLIVWLEAWLHTAGPILLLLPLGYAAQATWDDIQNNRQLKDTIKKTALPWTTSLLAMIILPTVNPNGINQIYIHLVIFLQNLSHHLDCAACLGWLGQQGNIPIATDNIPEFLPIWLFENFMPIYMIMGMATATLVLSDRRRINLLVNTLPLAFFAVIHVRGIGLWGLAILSPLTILALSLCSGRENIQSATALGRSGFMIIALIMGLISTARDNGMAQIPTSALPFTFGVQAIQANFPNGGNIFASYLLAPIIPWALGTRYKITRGGHMMFVRHESERHFFTVYNAEPGWQKELADYQVIAIASLTNENAQGRIIPIVNRIAYNPNWQLVALDAAGLTYLKLPEGQKLSPRDHLYALKIYWLRALKGARNADQPDSPPAQFAQALAQEQLKTLRQLSTLSDSQIASQLAPPQLTISLDSQIKYNKLPTLPH